MKLFTKVIRNKLIANHEATQEAEGDDLGHEPVVKLFDPYGASTWLLSELDPDTNIAFGLCDLGMGSPELGYVSIDEISEIKTPWGCLQIERDRSWTANKPLTDYASVARERMEIISYLYRPLLFK